MSKTTKIFPYDPLSFVGCRTVPTPNPLSDDGLGVGDPHSALLGNLISKIATQRGLEPGSRRFAGAPSAGTKSRSLVGAESGTAVGLTGKGRWEIGSDR